MSYSSCNTGIESSVKDTYEFELIVEPRMKSIILKLNIDITILVH